MDKRKLDISIISDVHLGAYECHAFELLKYLKSIHPEVLILNGDFIDTLKLGKKQLPKEHIAVIREILNMAFTGVKVYYITGNRDKILKYVSEISTNAIDIRDKLELQLKGRKYWVFHGGTFDDIFDVPPFVVNLGSRIYGMLLRSNRVINKWRVYFGKARMCYAGRIKNKVKQSIKAIQDFEETAIQLAIQEGYDYVICGHIHQPVIKQIDRKENSVVYMNSGDWVENLTALEYNFGKWQLYQYDELDYKTVNPKLYVRSKQKDFGSIVENIVLPGGNFGGIIKEI
jgi:UDP-2,3-diacylglucosamine pyrophosphatase LpxH